MAYLAFEPFFEFAFADDGRAQFLGFFVFAAWVGSDDDEGGLLGDGRRAFTASRFDGLFGGTLGHIALIFGLGAMLGRLISDAGGAQRIAVTLIEKFGEKNVQWAVVVASFIIGIALFFEVGLVLLVPIVLTMAKQMKLSPLHLGVPMCAALLATHAFLPPHPGPTVIAGEYGADIGQVLVYGILIAIPAVIDPPGELM